MLAWSCLILSTLLANDCCDTGLTACQLARMSRCELEALYRRLPPAPPLHCFHPGKAFKKNGEGLAKGSSLMWKGKVFAGCLMINRWCLGLEGVPAKVHEGESWLDGKPSLILDYRGSSKLIWRNARDEVRQVCPGLYLGIMYVDKACCPELVRFFYLEADCCGP